MGVLVLKEEVFTFNQFLSNSTTRPAHQALFQFWKLTNSAKCAWATIYQNKERNYLIYGSKIFNATNQFSFPNWFNPQNQ